MKMPKLGMPLATIGLAAACLALAGCDDETTVDAVCGDGVRNGAEACDGADLGGATCPGGGTISCTGSCTLDTSGCVSDACGNGTIDVDDGEECDGSDVGGTTCADEGFMSGTIACDSSCALDTSGCLSYDCDDGAIDDPEVCDGTDVGAADCVSEGFTAGTLACAASCLALDTSGCCDDACPADGDTECQGDTLRLCELQASGCLDWTETDCTANGELCDDTQTPAACVPPCTDECTTDGETLCNGSTLSVCEDSNSDGCLDLTLTDCNANSEVCDDTVSPAVCAPNGSGANCADAYWIQNFPAQFVGTDFTVDFPGNDHSFNGGTGCSGVSTSGGGGGIDAVFKVDLENGDELFVSEHGGMDVVMHIVAADATNCLTTTACLDSTDTGETIGIYYTATGSETVYVVIEKWSATSTVNGYDIRIDKITAVCGDVYVSPNEACDDGNTADNDGCSADCSTVEAGFECMPGFCYPAGDGDVCGTPIQITASMSFFFDTTGFTDNYGVNAGTNYTACGGDGGYGPDVVFAVDLAAGDILTVTGTEQEFTAALVLADDCANLEANCFSYQEAASTDLTGTYTNGTGATQTIYIIVDSGYSFSVQDGMIGLTFDIHTPTCGDGIIEGGEECDDTNTSDADGCSSTCTVEAGMGCVGEPSVCGTLVTATSSPALAIPDNNATGVTDTATAGSACTIIGLSVDVDITHTFIGDLIVELTAPDGTTTVRLHNRTGGTANQIIGNYPLTLTPAESLSAFSTLDGQGTWTLFVSDNAGADTGTLNSWGVNLICQ